MAPPRFGVLHFVRKENAVSPSNGYNINKRAPRVTARGREGSVIPLASMEAAPRFASHFTM